jgi:hypothetical protein
MLRTRTLSLALLAALALPAAAQAAPAKISPNPVDVTPAGVAPVEVANPNGYALSGKATVTIAGRTVASRSVRLPKRSVSVVKLRLANAVTNRATITMKLRRAGARRATTARRTVTLNIDGATVNSAPQGQAPSTGGPATAKAQAPAKTAPAPAPAAAPAPPASNKWVARMGTEGAYDDFEFTLDNGQMTITKQALVPVSCMENGGSYRIAVSLEVFDAGGPWTIGTNGLVAKQGVAVNQLVNSGQKTINYKVEETSQSAGKVTGKLGMSFSDSKLNILDNYSITFINCWGTQSFEAIPA